MTQVDPADSADPARARERHDSATQDRRGAKANSAPRQARATRREGAQADGAPPALARLRSLPRPAWPDVLAAALLAYVSAWNGPDPEDAPGTAFALLGGTGQVATGLYALLLVVGTLTVLLRRVAPTACVLVAGGVCLVHLLAFDSLSLLAVGTGLVAVETSASRVPRPWAWVLLAAQAVGAAAGTVLVSYRAAGLTMEPARLAVLVAVALVFVAAAALTGQLRRRSRDRREQVRERLELLAAQQETERRLAVARERTRIARDVHDLLGHSLSVISMQAEGARAVIAASPEQAERALAVIAETSRRSVDDVRALVDVLRADDEGAPTPAAGPGAARVPAHTAPAEAEQVSAVQVPSDPGAARVLSDPGTVQVPSDPGAVRVLSDPGAVQVPSDPGAAREEAVPVPRTPWPGGPVPDEDCRLARPAPGAGMDDLPRLVSTVRQAGASVRLAMTVNEAAPTAVGECLYRVVQEALTNAVRHAPGAAVTVSVHCEADGAEVVVDNAAPAGAGEDAAARAGLGLTSMAERVSAVGGVLDAGPQPDGRWRVHAVVPAAVMGPQQEKAL